MQRTKRPRMLRLIMGAMGILLMVSIGIQPASAQQDIVENTQGVLDYIRNNPDDVSVFCSIEGQDDTIVQHQVDETFPLASTFKILVLAEWGRQVDAGEIDPTTSVQLDEVNRYLLPGTDGGAHQAWLNTLEDDQETATLQEIAYGMIAYSSNANTDYLLVEHLGYDGFDSLYETLELDDTSPLTGTLLSLFLLQDNHDTEPWDGDEQDDDSTQQERDRLQTLYLTDEEWRTAEQDYRQRTADTMTPDESDERYTNQATFFEQYGLQGSTDDMIAVMDAIYADESTLFSDDTRTALQGILNWVMDRNPANRQVYDELGNKGGALAGILTSVWYVQPINGPVIRLSVFYEDVPSEQWLTWQSAGNHQQLEFRAFGLGEGCSLFADALSES